LLYRRRAQEVEVLLVLPGGPYWARRDAGAWQIPKGEIHPDEDPEMAARREVEEELGLTLDGPIEWLGEVRQAGGKLVTAFTAEREIDPATFRSIDFEMEWPPRSGRMSRFPEVAAAKWVTLEQARSAMLPSQLPLLDHLAEHLSTV
jgi:predicted NUDIX family NTP pyrophosphohydrolase